MIDWGINLVSISKGLLQLLNKDEMQAWATSQLLQSFLNVKFICSFVIKLIFISSKGEYPLQSQTRDIFFPLNPKYMFWNKVCTYGFEQQKLD